MDGNHMRETDADRAVKDRAYSVTAEELRQFVEQFQALDVETAEIAERRKGLMQEVKGRGYDTKCVRKIVTECKRRPDDLAEENAILGLYRAALGRD